MGTQKLDKTDAELCVDEIARDYEQMTYRELEKLWKAQEDDPEVFVQCVYHHGIELWVDTTFGKGGRIRKRISVEVCVADTQNPRAPIACAYLERFENGRLYRATRRHSAIISLFLVYLPIPIVALWAVYKILRAFLG